MPTAPSTPAPPLAIFFPPTPPVYGSAAISPSSERRIIRLNGQELKTPDELADFVGESFYPMVGSHLFATSLGKKLAARLSAYLGHRATLLNELETELQRVQNETPAVRRSELQAFALQQTPRVLALETEAEGLRHDLARGNFFGGGVDWDDTRIWRLGDASLSTGMYKSEAEFQVARAFAFFQDGFGIEQRGLLREIAIDLAQQNRATRSRRPLTATELRTVFFSPETTRLILPAPPPASLAGKIGRYNGEKLALKRELLEALTALDKASNSKRTSRFTALSERQWPRIAELERLAEEIRLDYETLPEPPPPWLPAIPPDLRQRMEAYTQDREKLMADFLAAQRTAQLPPIRPGESIFNLSREKRIQEMRERMKRLDEERVNAGREFQRQNAGRVAELNQRSEQIRGELADLAHTLTHPQTGQPLTTETLLIAYKIANLRFDAIGREEVIYRRYKIAMLQPGLSPAQRRLLFIAAHAGLAQDLPLPEYSTGSSSRPTPRS